LVKKKSRAEDIGFCEPLVRTPTGDIWFFFDWTIIVFRIWFTKVKRGIFYSLTYVVFDESA